jgi:hypothetical protein
MLSELSGRDFTDIFVDWTAAFGVLAYAAYLHRNRIRSTLETRTLFLLDCAGALFVVRGFFWLADENSMLGVLTFVPVTLFPLACTLFVEALLRRHVSLVLKVYVAAGTILFLSLDLLNRLAFDNDVLLGFLLFLVSTLAALTAQVVTRDRRQLSSAENRFVDVVTTVSIALIPLVISDFRKVFDWIPVPRMGGIAGLLFVYALMRPAGDSRPVRAVGLEMLGMLARGAIAAVALVVGLGRNSVGAFSDALAISVSAVLLTIVLERLKAVQLANREVSFLRWLLRADARSSEALIGSLRELPLTEEHITLKGADLEGYDAAAISRAFDDGRAVVSLASLRHELAARGEAVSQAVEELVHILEKYDMTHVALVCHDPPTLLLLNLPLVGIHLYEVQVQLIQKYFRLLERTTPELSGDVP